MDRIGNIQYLELILLYIDLTLKNYQKDLNTIRTHYWQAECCITYQFG